MAPILFRAALILVAFYAFLHGRRDERIVALTCVIGALATEILISPLRQRYSGIETGVMAVDMVVLIGFTAVALISSRFWPLWVAALQLTTVMGHALKALDTDLLPRAYGAAMQFWGYPILLIIAIGTWRTHRRVMEERPRLGTA